MAGASRLTILFALPVGLVSVYALFLALVLHPSFQAHNVFLHKINIPFHHDLSKPDAIRSIGKGRARNFHIRAADGVRIAGWHILPDNVDKASEGEEQELHFDRALRQAPVVLYFHGNAMNRAAPVRIHAYRTFAALNVNVVAIDYRGFGDSDGTPSEQGLLRDARAAYRWVVERQALVEQESPDTSLAGQILVSGQSLGTGVASRLTLDLIEAGRPTPAVLLLAPYVNIRQLLTSYRIGGFVPVFWPLGLSPYLASLADKHLYTRFESDKALYVAARGGWTNLEDEERRTIGPLDFQLDKHSLCGELGISPTQQNINTFTHFVISHADNDLIIPHKHGRTLFDRIHDAFSDTKSGDEVLSDDQIDIQDFAWGTMLSVAPQPGQSARLTLFKSRKGGHNGVPSHALAYFVNVAASGNQGPASRQDNMVL